MLVLPALLPLPPAVCCCCQAASPLSGCQDLLLAPQSPTAPSPGPGSPSPPDHSQPWRLVGEAEESVDREGTQQRKALLLSPGRPWAPRAKVGVLFPMEPSLSPSPRGGVTATGLAPGQVSVSLACPGRCQAWWAQAGLRPCPCLGRSPSAGTKTDFPHWGLSFTHLTCPLSLPPSPLPPSSPSLFSSCLLLSVPPLLTGFWVCNF